MLLIDMLIGADKTAIQDRKVQGIGVNVVAHPFKLGMISNFMARDRRQFCNGRRYPSPACYSDARARALRARVRCAAVTPE